MLSQKNIVTLPNFKLKLLNSDFIVDEVYLEPLYTVKGEATHTYLFVQKENITTFTLLQHLAEYFNLSEQAVSASGLKDEYAVTRQAISLGSIITEQNIQEANDFFAKSDLAISIVRLLGYGQEPMNPRQLHGNKFTITLRQLTPKIANNLADKLQANRFFQFINYYDEQRFGLPDSIHNTALIGQALLADDWATAYYEYVKSGINALEVTRAETTLAQYDSYQETMTKIVPRKLNFFISSYNSRLWNDCLTQKIAQLTDTVQVDLPHLGQISLPADYSAPLSSVLSIEVEKKDWQTGRNYHTIKTRPVIITVPVFVIDKSDDRLHSGQYQAVTVTFYLPTGCYATMLAKQLLLSTVIQLD